MPRILVGNRLHLAFKRQVPTEQARAYAEKNGMTFFEVSPLCNFNVIESFTELSRIVLMRHGMEKFWRPNRGERTRSGRAREGGDSRIQASDWVTDVLFNAAEQLTHSKRRQVLFSLLVYR